MANFSSKSAADQLPDVDDHDKLLLRFGINIGASVVKSGHAGAPTVTSTVTPHRALCHDGFIGILNRASLLAVLGAHCRRKLGRNEVRSGAVDLITRAVERKMRDVVGRVIHVVNCRTMTLPSTFINTDVNTRAQLRFLNRVSVAEQKRAQEAAARVKDPTLGGEVASSSATKKSKQGAAPPSDRQDRANETAMRSLQRRTTHLDVKPSPTSRRVDVAERATKLAHVFDFVACVRDDRTLAVMPWVTRLMITGKHKPLVSIVTTRAPVPLRDAANVTAMRAIKCEP